MEMIQLWVNLRAKHKKGLPRYQNITSIQTSEVPMPNGVGVVRVIAGGYKGVIGPAKTFTPVNIWDVRLHAGCHMESSRPVRHEQAKPRFSRRSRTIEADAWGNWFSDRRGAGA